MRAATSGFTLIELVTVIAVLGVGSAVFMMKGPTPALMTLPSQAQTLASDIRHVQTLATTLGRRLELTFTASGYSMSCVDVASPCPAFSVVLQKGVTLSSHVPAALDFNSLGQPLTSGVAGTATSASYTLQSGGTTKVVTVTQHTGFVANP